MNGVQDQWAVDLTINGQPIFIDLLNIFEEITTREHIHMDLPTLSFTCKDKGAQLLNEVGLMDGVQISAGIGDGSSIPVPQNFLAAGGPQVQPGPGAYVVQQSSTLAAPDWGKRIWTKTVTGNSSDVVSQMAQEAGLTPIVDSTSDQMTWQPNLRPMAHYARFVADHAYAQMDDLILMCTSLGSGLSGLSGQGNLLFKSLTNIVGSGGGVTIGFGDGEIPYLDTSFSSKGKVYNSVRGYGSTTVQDPGTGILTPLNQMTINAFGSGFTGLGSAFTAAADTLGLRVESSPVDSGNGHTNYRQANHQNLRIKSLFSEDFKVMLDRESGVNLLDMVTFNPVDMVTGAPLVSYTGPVLVTGKYKTAQANGYREILTLCTQPNSSNPG